MRRFGDSPIRVDDRHTFLRFDINGITVYAKECENAKSAHFSGLGAGVRAWHESARNHSHPAADTEAAQRAGRRIGQPSFVGGGGGLAKAANKLEAEPRRKDIEVEGGH